MLCTNDVTKSNIIFFGYCHHYRGLKAALPLCHSMNNNNKLNELSPVSDQRDEIIYVNNLTFTELHYHSDRLCQIIRQNVVSSSTWYRNHSYQYLDRTFCEQVHSFWDCGLCDMYFFVCLFALMLY